MFTLSVATDRDRLARATKDNIGGGRRISAIVASMLETDARCVICLTDTANPATPGDRPTLAHVLSAASLTPGAAAGKRGGYTPDNVLIACQECNRRIGDRNMTNVQFVPAYFGRPFPARNESLRATDNTKTLALAALGY